MPENVNIVISQAKLQLFIYEWKENIHTDAQHQKQMIIFLT